MSFWFLSVHMLCGLFMLISGSATFLLTFHVLASTAVAVPGLDLPAVISYSRLTHTSPTPCCGGVTGPGMGTFWRYRASSVVFRSTTAPPLIRTGTPAG